ncbi:MAG: sodium:solute symporter family protein [Planctomycetaceae bacterium]|nr:sodium:solute symporter family protein [Planctomycetaceae bacterium]
MLAQVQLFEILVVLVYLFAIMFLGILGYLRTKTQTDFLIAGRKVHPFVMAMSYGSTFISTSAIVGFGGVAAMFGMSLLWLTVCNIFVGIFIAFVFLGGPTRRMGHILDAHTFPELLGRRFQSKFIQVFVGLIIFSFMPIYAAAVLIGGTEFITEKFGINYNSALLLFSIITTAYVIMGGLKGVMYTDALQAGIMFFGMLVLLVFTYNSLGGVAAAHEQLAELNKLPSLFGKIGFQGFMEMPKFGWGAPEYELWWVVISTLVLGVGIGVLAQPQLAVRFMTVKSKRELNRAVLSGGIFILCMTGVAFAVGALTNVYFFKNETIAGRIVNITERANVIVKQERDIVVKIPCKLIHLDTNGDEVADTDLVMNGYDVEKDGKVTPFSKLMPAAEVTQQADGSVIVKPHAISFLRSLVKLPSGDWMFNSDAIIPKFITSAMPKWFGLVFLLTLLSAAMSTLSSQLHAVGTSIGRDIYEQIPGRAGKGLIVIKSGIILGILIAVLFSYFNRGGYIIARATAIFFGMCAAAFLPAFVGGLFWRRMTKAGAIASLIAGFAVSAAWMLFFKDKEARAIGLCYELFEKYSLLLDKPNWSVVDPLIIALPISIITGVVVSLITKAPSQEHLDRCFQGAGRTPVSSHGKAKPVKAG